MHKPEYIRLSDHSEATDIYELRLQAYLQSPEFTLIQSGFLVWDHSDETEFVLTAYDADGTPVATMSANVLFDMLCAHEKMRCGWNYQPGRKEIFPALLLSKGATLKNFRFNGIHSILRYYMIRAARRCSINSVLGTVFEAAPRTNQMHCLGYEFVVPEEIWDLDQLIPKKQTLVGVLEKDRYQFALATLSCQFASIIETLPFEEEKLTTRLMELAGAVKENRTYQNVNRT